MKKKLFVVPAILSCSVLASCGGGNQNARKITLISDTLQLSSDNLEVGKEFKATVSLKDDVKATHNLPATLGYIEVEGGDDISYMDYTYAPSKDADSAEIIIPGEFVTNNLTITAEAKLVKYNVNFTKSVAFSSKVKSVGKKESLDTNVFIKDDYEGYVELPAYINVYIGDSTYPLDRHDYTYEIMDGGARLKIDAAYIDGDINITSTADPDDYGITIVDKNNALQIDNTRATVIATYVGHFKIDDEKKAEYTIPEKKDDIAIKCKDSKTNEVFDVPFDYNSETGSIHIASGIILGELTIIADSRELPVVETHKFYHQGDLLFTTIDDEEIFTDYKPSEWNNGLQFKLKVNQSNDRIIIVPEHLHISVADITVPDNKYEVEYADEGTNYQEATVTIDKEWLFGDIYVVANEVVADYYEFETASVQIDFTGLPKAGYVTKGEDIVCQIKSKDSYEAPTAENVNIQINDKWYDGNGYHTDTEKTDLISFNATTGTLTIKSDIISTLQSGKKLVIAAKPANLSVLKEVTKNSDWTLLHKLSKYGYALFDIGELTSPFEIAGQAFPFKARLIGINQEHDEYGAGYINGLTLELVSCVQNNVHYYSYNKGRNSYYDNGLYKFESEPYSTLNNDVITKLPEGLVKNLYTVGKLSIRGSGGGSTEPKQEAVLSKNKLFPLSLIEMNEGLCTSGLDTCYEHECSKDNTPYAYYQSFKDADSLKAARIKDFAGTASAYWLRSPDVNKDKQDWSIRNNGTTSSAGQTTMCLAPAFCI